MDQSSSIADHVRTIVAGHMGKPSVLVTVDLRLGDDLGLDWFDLEEIVVFLSEAYEANPEFPYPTDLDTVNDLVRLAETINKDR